MLIQRSIVLDVAMSLAGKKNVRNARILFSGSVRQLLISTH